MLFFKYIFLTCVICQIYKGGWYNRRQLVQFDTRTNTITSDNAADSTITTDIACVGQGCVQKNDLLYMIPDSGTHFTVFNLCMFSFVLYTQNFLKTIVSILDSDQRVQ